MNKRARDRRRVRGAAARSGGEAVQYPLATVIYYGPDNRKATKVAVGILRRLDEEPEVLRRWVGDSVVGDARIQGEIADFIKEHRVRSVIVNEGVSGCPHEEEKDYPLGESCPFCPFWKDRPRNLGKGFLLRRFPEEASAGPFPEPQS